MRIIALHGQLGLASDWDNIKGQLSSFGHDLEAVDLWSFLEKKKLSMADFGKEINQLEKGSDKEVLLGYSMGGRLALHALLDDPSRWKMAIIVSAHSGLAEEDRSGRRMNDDVWQKKVENLPWSELLDQWNGQGVLANNMMPERESLESRRSEVARSFACWSLAEQENLITQLADIDLPVLFITGATDEKFTMQGQLFKEGMKRADLCVISGTGHRVPWEAEEDFIRIVSEWINVQAKV